MYSTWGMSSGTLPTAWSMRCRPYDTCGQGADQGEPRAGSLVQRGWQPGAERTLQPSTLHLPTCGASATTV